MNYRLRGLRVLIVLILLATFSGSQLALAQTQTASTAPAKIVLHKNKYSPMDDVRIGREAAGQAERQFQIVRDPQLAEYL